MALDETKDRIVNIRLLMMNVHKLKTLTLSLTSPSFYMSAVQVF